MINLQDKAREAALSAEARKLPATEVERLHKIYSELAGIAPENALYRKRRDHYSDKWSQLQRRASSQLELVSWSWTKNHGWAEVDGRVRNVSGVSLKNVEAVVTFMTSSGSFITSDTALIEYNPILPGQTSPFKVMARSNPAMSKASIDFKTLFGGSLKWYKAD